MENQSSKRSESEQLIHAYRSWSSHLKAAKPEAANLIFMDDLTNISLIQAKSSGWIETFHQFLRSNRVFEAHEILKIEQSLNFSRFMDESPSRMAVEACGGKFEDEKSVLDDIEELTRQIEDMESRDLPEFPPIEVSSHQYALMIAQQGFEFMNSHNGRFHPLDFELSQIDPLSPFLAQVITKEPGKIVCEIPFDRPVNPAFSALLIHEILGHVFHFSQLKNSSVGEETPHLLCLSLHTHEGFFIEAITQLITTYLSSKSSWALPGRAQIALHDLRYQRTQAIAHYMISMMIDGKINTKEAVLFHHTLSKKSMTLEFLKERYESLTKNLFTMKSTLNYYPSFKAVKPLLNLSEEDFFKTLGEMVITYFTPEKLEKFVRERMA